MFPEGKGSESVKTSISQHRQDSWTQGHPRGPEPREPPSGASHNQCTPQAPQAHACLKPVLSHLGTGPPCKETQVVGLWAHGQGNLVFSQETDGAALGAREDPRITPWGDGIGNHSQCPVGPTGLTGPVIPNTRPRRVGARPLGVAVNVLPPNLRGHRDWGGSKSGAHRLPGSGLATFFLLGDGPVTSSGEAVYSSRGGDPGCSACVYMYVRVYTCMPVCGSQEACGV